MSLLWSERLCIALLPDRMAWVVLARGLGQRVRARGSVYFSLGAKDNLWQAAIEALQRELPNIPITRGEVSVVLSNSFVRYLVINSGATLTGSEERLALAGYDFKKIYGEQAESWEIRLASGEQNYLATALDSELLARLRLCFAKTRLELKSVQPYAVAAFNYWAKHFGGDAAEGIYIAEPHGYCYAGMNDGQWEFIRCGRWEGGYAETFQRVVQREAFRTGTDARSVWLTPSLDAPATKDVKVLPLDVFLTDAQQAEYLIAMLGAK